MLENLLLRLKIEIGDKFEGQEDPITNFCPAEETALEIERIFVF